MIAEQAMRRSLPSLAAAGSVRSRVDKIEVLVLALSREQRRCQRDPAIAGFLHSNILGDIDLERKKGLARGHLRASFD